MDGGLRHRRRRCSAPAPAQYGAIAGCARDEIEERLFELQSDMLTDLLLVFVDTTTLLFRGAGGESLRRTATPRIIAPTCGRWCWR